MVINIDTKVNACNESTKVNVDDSGKMESIIYLLPTAANREPTLNPNLDSILSAWIKKHMYEIKNDTYIHKNNLKNSPHALRSI